MQILTLKLVNWPARGPAQNIGPARAWKIALGPSGFRARARPVSITNFEWRATPRRPEALNPDGNRQWHVVNFLVEELRIWTQRRHEASKVSLLCSKSEEEKER